MSGFAYENLFAKSVPAPAVRFAGYPKYNFIGGHNDPTLIPIEGLIEATASALRKEGANLAMYTAAQGNQGHLGLREFVKSKAKLRRDLGWVPQENFDTGLRKTVRWYLDNRWWWEPIWYGRYTGARLGAAPAAAEG